MRYLYYRKCSFDNSNDIPVINTKCHVTTTREGNEKPQSVLYIYLKACGRLFEDFFIFFAPRIDSSFMILVFSSLLVYIERVCAVGVPRKW